MAPELPSNTRRWFLTYTVGGLEHTVQMRTSDAIDASAATSALDQVLDALSPGMWLTTINFLEVSLKGSNVRNIAPWTGNLTYGVSAQTGEARPRFVSFVGRSSGGRRVRVTVFGWNGGQDADFRYVQGQDARVDAALTVLNGLPNSFIAIDGLKPLFKLYGNTGLNAYWQRAIRP